MSKPKICVAVADGERERKYLATGIIGEAEGYKITYKADGEDQEVMVPKGYKMVNTLAPGKDLFIFNRYWPTVARWRNSVGAVPLYGTAPDLPGQSYHLLLKQHGMYPGYMRMTGKGKIPMWLIALGLVAVLAIGAFYFMNQGDSSEVPENQMSIEEAIEAENQ